MRARTCLTAAATAFLLAAPTVTSAHAEDDPQPPVSAVLTYGSPGGTPVSVGDVLTADLVEGTYATLYSSADGSSGVKCAASSFSATVTSNPDAPSVAGENLDSHTFGSCTSNVFGVRSVQSVTVNALSYNHAVSSDSGHPTALSPGEAGTLQTTVVLRTLLGTITCVYRADGITGNASNDDQTLRFVDQAFAKYSGPSLCLPMGYFSATYGPVRDSSAPDSPAIYVN
ncbi:Tat pathway signal sequence domain protein (plasmid) [Kitasatospora sp. NBC_00070]|uniref:Tat pathway signal sequence domain protein n=1 Tax=Kitasatospora sp. NBC_00070 TaxID=2975962 RepID=UPI002F91B890